MAAADLLSYIPLGHKLAILVVYDPSLGGRDSSSPVQHSTGGRQRTIYYKERGELRHKDWETSIKRAVLGEMRGWVDEEYKLETEKARAQAGPDGYGTIPNTANAIK